VGRAGGHYDELAGAYNDTVDSAPLERAKRWAHSAVMKKAAAFTVWSDWAKRSLVKDYGAPESKVTVLHPGTVISSFPDPHARKPRSGQPLNILFVGGDFPRKGGDLLLDGHLVVSSGTLDPRAGEDVMDNSIKTHTHHSIAPANSLQTLADALPALGIVAAVLGVVKTMAAIDQPPAILGEMIGSALVGTFLGVLLAYGFVGPFANRARQVIEGDSAIYHVVKQIIIASLHGHPLPLVIEAARSSIAHANQPAFADVFDGMRAR
jgi:hypothetical protein